MATIGACAVDGKKVQSVDRVGNQAAGHDGVAHPAFPMALGLVLDSVVARPDLARAVQQQGQVMAMGAELELEIGIVGTDKENLADLKVP